MRCIMSRVKKGANKVIDTAVKVCAIREVRAVSDTVTKLTSTDPCGVVDVIDNYRQNNSSDNDNNSDK